MPNFLSVFVIAVCICGIIGVFFEYFQNATFQRFIELQVPILGFLLVAAYFFQDGTPRLPLLFGIFRLGRFPGQHAVFPKRLRVAKDRLFLGFLDSVVCFRYFLDHAFPRIRYLGDFRNISFPVLRWIFRSRFLAAIQAFPRANPCHFPALIVRFHRFLLSFSVYGRIVLVRFFPLALAGFQRVRACQVRELPEFGFLHDYPGTPVLFFLLNFR